MIIVSATSFMRDKKLCRELEAQLAGQAIHYYDLREAAQRKAFFASKDAVAWLVGGEKVSALELDQFPNLQVIAKYGVGVDNIDFDACEARGIKIAWEPGVNRDAVAEHAIGLMLGMTRRIAVNSRSLARGEWIKNGGRNLSGMKVGIIGLGHIGSRVAEILKAFHCDIRFCDIVDKTALAERLQIEAVSYEELLGWADLLSFHVPLTSRTLRMLDEKALSAVKSGLFIVNTSRGPVIDQKALLAAMNQGRVAAAGLDVFEVEPLGQDPLAFHEGLLGTPHTAGNSEEAVWAMGNAAIEGLKLYLKTTDSRP